MADWAQFVLSAAVIGTIVIIHKAECSRLPVGPAAVLIRAVYAVGVWAVHSAS
jgi:hypothetical protein